MSDFPADRERLPTQVPPAETPGLTSLLTLAVAVVVIAGLYLGRDVLIPITLAVLLSFLIAPARQPAAPHPSRPRALGAGGGAARARDHPGARRADRPADRRHRRRGPSLRVHDRAEGERGPRRGDRPTDRGRRADSGGSSRCRKRRQPTPAAAQSDPRRRPRPAQAGAGARSSSRRPRLSSWRGACCSRW